jgi:anti-sigma factor RsiW
VVLEGYRSTVTATGGSGGLETALSLTGGTPYTVTVGAGGAEQMQYAALMVLTQF